MLNDVAVGHSSGPPISRLNENTDFVEVFMFTSIRKFIALKHDYMTIVFVFLKSKSNVRHVTYGLVSLCTQ